MTFYYIASFYLHTTVSLKSLVWAEGTPSITTCNRKVQIPISVHVLSIIIWSILVFLVLNRMMISKIQMTNVLSFLNEHPVFIQPVHYIRYSEWEINVFGFVFFHIQKENILAWDVRWLRVHKIWTVFRVFINLLDLYIFDAQ